MGIKSSLEQTIGASLAHS